MKTAHLNKQKGFTLIELLTVITIVATLLVTVFVAINPSTRLLAARNAKRTSDLDTILTATHEYIVDNKGSAPAGLSTVEQQIGTATTGCAISTGGCAVTAVSCLNLGTTLAAYLASMPIDPTGGTYTAGATGYSIVQNSNGIVTVKACGSEGTPNLATSR